MMCVGSVITYVKSKPKPNRQVFRNEKPKPKSRTVKNLVEKFTNRFSTVWLSNGSREIAIATDVQIKRERANEFWTLHIRPIQAIRSYPPQSRYIAVEHCLPEHPCEAVHLKESKQNLILFTLSKKLHLSKQ